MGDLRRSTGRRAAFTLVEVLVSLAVVAVLLGVLLPVLTYARDAGRAAVCLNNLRQIGLGFRAYAEDHGHLPATADNAEWQYGGARFPAGGGAPFVASDRPLNAYLAGRESAERRGNPGGSASFLAAGRVAELFHCPADRGVPAEVTLPGAAPISDGARPTVFERVGTSYMGNSAVLRVPPGGAESLSVTEIDVAPSRLLLAGDPVWHFGLMAARAGQTPTLARGIAETSWHGPRSLGHVVTWDGSARSLRFDSADATRVTLSPRARD